MQPIWFHAAATSRIRSALQEPTSGLPRRRQPIDSLFVAVSAVPRGLGLELANEFADFLLPAGNGRILIPDRGRSKTHSRPPRTGSTKRQAEVLIYEQGLQSIVLQRLLFPAEVVDDETCGWRDSACGTSPAGRATRSSPGHQPGLPRAGRGICRRGRFPVCS